MTFAMKIREEKKETAIETTIKIAKQLNTEHNTIIMLLQNNFKLTPKEAEETLNDYEAEEQNE